MARLAKGTAQMPILFNLAAIAAFGAGGFAMMFGQRKTAGRLILFALFLDLASGLAPRLA